MGFLVVLLAAQCLVYVNPTSGASSVTSPRTIIVPDDFPTIKGAIDNASAGDTVFVRAGTYNITTEGHVSFYSFICLPITKPISLIGESCKNTIINATVAFETLLYSGIKVEADNVIISGFTITSNRNAVQLLGNNNTLAGNIIQLTGDGLAVGNGDGNVSSNVIEGAGRGDGINTNTNSIVSHNIIRNFNVGVTSLLGETNQSLFDNTIVNNIIGLRLDAPALLYQNNFENNFHYNIYLTTTKNLNATYNYWGTTNQTEIENSIYDNKNDALLGTVNFTPFLTVPNPNAIPIQPSKSTIPELSWLIILPLFLFVVFTAVLIEYRKRAHIIMW
jgi:hypothetical protein